MWRYLILVVEVCLAGSVLAQEQKHFKIAPSSRYKTVTLNYGSSSGTCYLSPGKSDELLAVYSNRDIDEFNHSFNKSTFNNNLEVNLDLEDKNKQTFSQSISNKVFNTSDKESNVWKVVLNEEIPYNLNLAFGIGLAYIDLSGIRVHKFKVKTGSADVHISYLNDEPNLVSMDSFSIKVDLGNVEVQKLNMANARVVHAEVGFGTMQLDFDEAPTTSCSVNASVGAGTLEIIIPKNNCSVKIKIEDSMLCDVRLTKSFTEISENVFVNEAYTQDSSHPLTFAVDVSMGNIIFKEKR